MLTMLLGGLWHGAAWTFVVWGAIHGVGLVGRALAASDARRGRARAAVDCAARATLARLVTFHVVCLAWVFFRADSFATPGDDLPALFDAWGEPSPPSRSA